MTLTSAVLSVEEHVSLRIGHGRRLHRSDEAVVKLVPAVVDIVETVASVVAAPCHAVVADHPSQVVHSLDKHEPAFVGPSYSVALCLLTCLETQSSCSQGDMSRSSSGKDTRAVILLLNAKSCLNLLRWIHRVSGSSVTREYLIPFRSFLHFSQLQHE